MSLISGQCCNTSKYSFSKNKYNYESTFSGTNYESCEKTYHREPKFLHCPLDSQSGNESDENYLDDFTMRKNVSITSLCEDCLSCSVTSPVRELNTDLYRQLPINCQDLMISNLNSDSDGENSSGTYLKSNATMNKTLPNISSEEFCELRQCRVKKNESCSSSMTSGRELTPTALRIGRPAICNNFQYDYHRGEEVGEEEDEVNSQKQESQYGNSTNCELILKSLTTDLVNRELEKFNDVQCQTFAQCNVGEKSSSVFKLDKTPLTVMKKKQNRLPFTISDNNEKYLEVSNHNCDSNVNINRNIVETRKTDTNTSVKDNNEEFKKLSSSSKNKIFRSWMKGFTEMFASPIKKKNSMEQNLNIEILFENNQCPYSSSEMNINNQMNCCNCDENRMELCSKKRFRRLNCDDLWIQDIVPVCDANNTDSRYSLFLVKNARDKITRTNSREIDLPSAQQCAKCQCLLVTPSLAIDTDCQQSIANSSSRGKKTRTHARRKLLQQCFCFRMWHSFCRESKKPIMRKT